MSDDLSARDAKLIQYLNEAYGKEKELETALQAHIKMAEKLLKNAKTELWNEYEEIGNYVAIETLAQAVGDNETEKLVRDFRRQEARLAAFLVKLLPQLTEAVATEEIPAAERRAAAAGRRTRSRTSSGAASRRSSAPSSSTRRQLRAGGTASAS